jgi:hypothetical protein
LPLIKQQNSAQFNNQQQKAASTFDSLKYGAKIEDSSNFIRKTYGKLSDRQSGPRHSGGA